MMQDLKDLIIMNTTVILGKKVCFQATCKFSTFVGHLTTSGNVFHNFEAVYLKFRFEWGMKPDGEKSPSLLCLNIGPIATQSAPVRDR